MTKKKITKNKGVLIYQGKSGAIELRGDFAHETIWATQAQIADLFTIERSVATKHIHNVLKDKELDVRSVCAKFAHTATDGKKYTVQFYNLDLVLAVGYRANSRRAIEFRQWATKTLRQYIVDGYAINRDRIGANYAQFLEAVEHVKQLLPAGAAVDMQSVLELVNAFTDHAIHMLDNWNDDGWNANANALDDNRWNDDNRVFSRNYCGSPAFLAGVLLSRPFFQP